MLSNGYSKNLSLFDAMCIIYQIIIIRSHEDHCDYIYDYGSPPNSKICWHVLRKLRAIYDTTRNLALVIFLSLPLMYYITSKSSNSRSFVINSFCRHDNKIQKSRRKNEWIAWYNNYNDWKILINKIGRGSVCNYVRQNRVVFISIIAIVPRIFFFLI